MSLEFLKWAGKLMEIVVRSLKVELSDVLFLKEV